MSEDRKIIRLRDVVATELEGGWTLNTDADVLLWLRSTITRQTDVQWSHLMIWCARYNMVNRLETAKTNASLTDQSKSAAAFVLAHVNAGQPLPLGDNEVRSFLSTLRTESVITAAEAQNILAYSDETVPVYEYYSVPKGLGAIERARAIS